MTKERKWWTALLLQLYLGSGYIYVGRIKRLAVYVISMILGGVASLLPPPSFVDVRVYTMGTSLALLLFSVFFLIDVVRLAQSQKDYKIKAYNRWWVYPLYWIAVSIVFGALMFAGSSNFKIPYYSAPFTENAPGLLPGDTIFAEICDGACSNLQRGDMIVFRLPKLGRNTYIRRIITGER